MFAATGRHLLEICYLPLGDITFDGYVILTGQACLDGRRNYIWEEPLEKEDTRKMIRIFNQREVPVSVIERDRIYLNFINSSVREAQDAISSPVPPVGTYLGCEVYQFIVYARKEKLEELGVNLRNCVITSWNPKAVDVTSRNVGKVKGMRFFMDQFGIRQDEIMAFGDGENDIDMLTFAGTGVAMGNADEEVKRHADYVTDAVSKDGVKKALEHFGLI